MAGLSRHCILTFPVTKQPHVVLLKNREGADQAKGLVKTYTPLLDQC